MAAIAAILDFRSARLKLFFIYKSPRCFLASLESIGLAVQEKKRKIDFQDGGHGGHLGFSIGTILAIFDLQVTPMLPSKFGVNWPFGSGEEAKIDFQDGGHGGHLGFPIGRILAIFDLQVTLMLPNKYRVNWPRGLGGVGFKSNCWRRPTDDARRTTDIDWPQWLTMSTSCSGELKRKNTFCLSKYSYESNKEWWQHKIPEGAFLFRYKS